MSLPKSEPPDVRVMSQLRLKYSVVTTMSARIAEFEITELKLHGNIVGNVCKLDILFF